MSKCLELSHAQGLLLDTDAELYDWFTQQISKTCMLCSVLVIRSNLTVSRLFHHLHYSIDVF